MFLGAPNTSDMHRDNLNFVSSEREWFFQNGKMDSFLKGKIFPFGSNCQNEFVVWTDGGNIIPYL